MPPVEVIRLSQTDDRYQAVVDRPGAMRFREPATVSPSPGDGGPRLGRYRVEVADGEFIEIATDETPAALRRVARLETIGLDEWCGWYDAEDRTVLLTQFPEEDFGEPMCLLQTGDEVMRAYPLDERSLVREDGTTIELLLDPADGRPALRIGGDILSRTGRFHESPVSFPVGDATLAGTLITPAGPGPHPAAVFVHGAAGGQRDMNRLFADALLEAGVAVLLYDKRGHGRSTGATDPTIFDQADAAAAALDLLRGMATIDSRRVGLLGFSNGMWAVPMAAAADPDVTFVAGIGSPGVSMAESEVHRRTKLLRSAGVGAETVTAVAETWRCLFDLAADGKASPESVERLTTLLATVRSAPDVHAYQEPAYARQNPMLSAIPPRMPVADLVAMVTSAPDPELAHDPADDYRRLRCPVFLQYGSEDTSVPVSTSVERLGAALQESGDPRTAIRVYSNSNTC